MTKKVLFTLNIGDYAPEITKITYPLLKHYAHKIGAEFFVINTRKFSDWPVTYEKLQIQEIAKGMNKDWFIYIDSDAVIHPDTIDWTAFLKKDTVAHNGRDFASIRWRYNNYFLRDGRNWGSCNWFTIASDWCLDLWTPLDIPLKEALDNIYPTAEEGRGTTTNDHLIDDYALSYNIARFGLKATTILELQKEIGFADSGFHYHLYNMPEEEKIDKIKDLVFEQWKLGKYIK